MASSSRSLAPALITVWACAVVFGSITLWDYGARPGAPGHPPERWPADLARDPRRHTVVLFGHPRCPCTLASAEELLRLQALCGDRIEVLAYLIRPLGCEPGWERSRLWETLEAAPGVDVRVDSGGRLAWRMGIATSGDVALYDPAGRLVFSGGITDSRGHAGSNLGRNTVVAHVLGDQPDTHTTPVFGCELFSEAEKSALAGSTSGGCCAE